MKTIYLSLKHRPRTTCVTGSQTVNLFLPLNRPRPHTTLQLALCCVYDSRLFSPNWFCMIQFSPITTQTENNYHIHVNNNSMIIISVYHLNYTKYDYRACHPTSSMPTIHTICYICFLARFQPSYFLVTLLTSRSFLLTYNCSTVAFCNLQQPCFMNCSIVAFAQLITGRLLIIAAASSRTTIDLPQLKQSPAYIVHQSMIRFSKHYRPVTWHNAHC